MNKKVKIILEIIALIIIVLAVIFFVTRQVGHIGDNQTGDLSHFWEMKVEKELPPEALEKFQARHENAVASLKINNDLFAAWVDLGTAKKAMGDQQGALDVWLHLNEIRPNNSTSFRNAGEIYMEEYQDYNQAEEMFQTAKKNDPTKESIYLQIAWLYNFRDTDKKHLVDDVILEGLEQVPDSQQLTVYLADWYLEQGEKDKAIEYYEKAIELMPDNEALRDKLYELKK